MRATLVALLLAGCAARPPAPPPVASTPAAPDVHYGVVLRARPALAGGMRLAILTALGTPAPASTTAATEFIVREDDGRTLSVVQANAEGLREGERVAIHAGERTRLDRIAHAGLAAPGG